MRFSGKVQDGIDAKFQGQISMRRFLKETRETFLSLWEFQADKGCRKRGQKVQKGGFGSEIALKSCCKALSSTSSPRGE